MRCVLRCVPLCVRDVSTVEGVSLCVVFWVRAAEPRVQGMGRGGRGWSITCFNTHPREDVTYRARGGGRRVADAPDMRAAISAYRANRSLVPHTVREGERTCRPICLVK